MKIKFVSLIFIAVCVFFSSAPDLLLAQTPYNLEANLVKILNAGYGSNYISGYLQSFVTVFGEGMGGGLYHRGYVKQFPHFDLGISAVYVNLPSSASLFPYEGINQPSFFGALQPGLSGIPGSGITEFYLTQIQLNLGLTSNAELLLKGSNQTINEVGDIRLLGIGIKYGLTDIIPISFLALNVSVQAVYQTMKVEAWLNSATFGMNIHASSQMIFLPVQLYGGIGYEITALKIDTNKLDGVGPNGIGEISMEGENDIRMNLGLSYSLFILNLHLDYNLGTYNSITGGVMLNF